MGSMKMCIFLFTLVQALFALTIFPAEMIKNPPEGIIAGLFSCTLTLFRVASEDVWTVCAYRGLFSIPISHSRA